MRVAASRMEVLESVADTRTSVRAFLPSVSAHAAAVRTLLTMGGGMMAAGLAARMLSRKSSKMAASAAAAGARRTSPWLALALQLGSAVVIPLLRQRLAAGRGLPAPAAQSAPHPLGIIGTMFNLPRIDLNPTRAFYRWLGLEK